jgi:fumarate reductase subunit C
MSERQLFVLQRLSALVLGPLVIVHLLLILYAVRNGLTAAEILGRTQGSVPWAAFYGAFVLAAAIHAPIGLRNVLREWTGLSRRAVDWSMAAFAILLAVLGLRAVLAVVGG